MAALTDLFALMSRTSADSGSSPTDQAPREEDDTQGCVLEEDLLSQWNGREGNEIVATEKVAVRPPVAFIISNLAVFEG